MSNFNFVVIEGNLTEDPKASPAPLDPGSPCSFSISSTRSYTKQDGEKVEESKIFDIFTEGKLGEVCLHYLKKGSRVLLSGSLTPSGILAKEVNFLSASKAS